MSLNILYTQFTGKNRLAKIKLPDYKEKQKTLYRDNTPQTALIAYGDKYLEAERISDAIDFYQKANHIEGLEKIREMVVADGDVMDFQHTLNALNVDASREEWNRIGEQALELKKYIFAINAFEKGENNSMVEKIKELMTSGRNQKTE
ncbi:MAG: hypothetical protein U9M96_00305 [Thermodesulfobacteriota bacterium]|nr:hypothetical protein [Thermodesulfobacteriota bacterium]